MDTKTAGILRIIEAARGRNGRRSLAVVFSDIAREVEYLTNEAARKAVEAERARVESEKNRIPFTSYNTPAIVAALQFNASTYGRNKIQAIKLLREGTGCGLKEAKDEIERRLQYEPEKWGYPPDSEAPPRW